MGTVLGLGGILIAYTSGCAPGHVARSGRRASGAYTGSSSTSGTSTRSQGAVCTRSAGAAPGDRGIVPHQGGDRRPDEHETGLRRTLNFGHTAGHALEAVTKYRRFRHGEAVAYGMLAAAALATKRGVFPEADRAALQSSLVQMGPLPPVGDLVGRAGCRGDAPGQESASPDDCTSCCRHRSARPRPSPMSTAGAARGADRDRAEGLTPYSIRSPCSLVTSAL